MTTINNLSKLSASEIFKTSRSTTEIKNTLNSINASKNRIVPEEVRNSIGIIDKRLKVPGKLKVLDDFISGRVNLIFSEERIPSYISTFPYVDRMEKSKLKIGVIANRCIGRDRSDITNINTFYALMQTGYLRRNIMLNFDRYTSNSKLQVTSAVAYSRLASRVMDKLFSINVDKNDSDVISYLFAKFCLIKMMGKADGKMTNSIAGKAAFNGTALTYLEEQEAVFKQVNPALYTSIFELFSAIASSHKVNIRSFISDYARMYGEASLLALDFYPAFLEMLAAVAVNGYLYNDIAVKGTLNALLGEALTQILFID